MSEELLTANSIYPSISPSNIAINQQQHEEEFISKPAAARVQFEKFRSPDRYNAQLWRHFIRRNYGVCKKIIDDVLTESGEALCEYQLILRAQIAREEGELRESTEWLLRAQKNNHRSIKIILELGKTYYLNSMFSNAIEVLAKGIEANSDKNIDWRFYYWQSLSYYHVGGSSSADSIEKAQEILLLCHKININADMLTFLGRLLAEKNDFMPAIEAYKKSIQFEPENADLIHSLGMLYLKANDPTNALATFGKALSCEQTHVPSILSLASILQENGDYEAALNKYKIAASEFDHSFALWNNIGMCFYGREKFISALICLNRANYLSPLDWKVRYNLSLVYTKLKQFASAYHFISSSFSIYPQNADIISTMAIILTELEDYRNARGAYKKSLKLEPSNLVARINFSIFELKRKNFAEAAKRLGNFEESFETLGEYSELVARLRQTFLYIASEQNRSALERINSDSQ